MYAFNVFFLFTFVMALDWRELWIISGVHSYPPMGNKNYGPLPIHGSLPMHGPQPMHGHCR